MSYFFESIQNFMQRGGGVLYLIFLTIFVLWLLIIERFWYFHFNFPKEAERILKKWKSPPLARTSSNQNLSSDKSSRQTFKLFSKIREADLSALGLLLSKNISAIKTLTALCPLMGLLGTVTGMITVFEIMSAVGTGNARLMASGVSMATIPTMAGMVGALSGIYVARVLENRVRKEKQKLNNYFSKLFIF